MSPLREGIKPKACSGVKLIPGEAGKDGEARRIEVVDGQASHTLPWDRYVRLWRAAHLVEKFLRPKQDKPARVLDVGFDGAMALFLPQHEVWVLRAQRDDFKLAAPDNSFDLVISLETMDHCPQGQRPFFLDELTRLAPVCLVGYSRASSFEAQKIWLDITDSSYAAEVLQCGPVDDSLLQEKFAARGLKTSFYPHTSTAAWLSFSTLYGLNSAAGDMLSRYLIEHLEEEESKHPFYQIAFGC